MAASKVAAAAGTRGLGASTIGDSLNAIAPIRGCLLHACMAQFVRVRHGCKRQPEPEIRVSVRTVACGIWQSASQVDNVFLSKRRCPEKLLPKTFLHAPGAVIVPPRTGRCHCSNGWGWRAPEIGSTTCKYLGSVVVKKYDAISMNFTRPANLGTEAAAWIAVSSLNVCLVHVGPKKEVPQGPPRGKHRSSASRGRKFGT